jgi:hypothetical protein
MNYELFTPMPADTSVMNRAANFFSYIVGDVHPSPIVCAIAPRY